MVHEFLVEEVTANPSNQKTSCIIKEEAQIGEGAFGTVIRAYLKPSIPISNYSNNHNQNQNHNSDWLGPFAIKKVPAQTEYKSRELEILRSTNHPNIVSLKFFFNYPNSKDHNKLYQFLVMESLPLNLQLEIGNYNKANLKINEDLIKIYIFQLARGMNYLHSFNICHRDIKPSNILVNSFTKILKICDFGSAKKLESNQVSVSYICSRYYRAPELIIGCTLYTCQIDTWGLGCVMGELYLGKAVFQGEEPIFQLREITKLLGPPKRSFIMDSNPHYDGPTFNTSNNSNNKISPIDLKAEAELIYHRFSRVFKNASPLALDLLTKILVYKPKERLYPKQVMSHPFFNDLKNSNFKIAKLPGYYPHKLTTSGSGNDNNNNTNNTNNITNANNDNINTNNNNNNNNINNEFMTVKNILFNFSDYELSLLGSEASNVLNFS